MVGERPGGRQALRAVCRTQAAPAGAGGSADG